MTQIISAVPERHLLTSLDLVYEVFTEHENEQEGSLVRRLTEEIRASENYVPSLDLVTLDESDNVIGYAMFSDFSLEGRYSGKLLLLSPVAVKTRFQRQHISKRMLEYGFEQAIALGYEAVIVEGNPANYRSRGFVTSADHGIVPGENLHLPHIDCLMVKELKKGALKDIHGAVEYPYKALKE